MNDTEQVRVPIAQSNLTVTIIGLVIAACLLAIVFVYMEMNHGSPTHNIADPRVEAINNAVASLRQAAPASLSEIQAGLKQISVSGVVQASQGQIDDALRQLKAN
ncbi:MAG: hypothetical protein KGJ35_00165 [Patescibacteria group bacterium]|nr:hypothetical protein [Patescibacteria group bacterium]